MRECGIAAWRLEDRLVDRAADRRAARTVKVCAARMPNGLRRQALVQADRRLNRQPVVRAERGVRLAEMACGAGPGRVVVVPDGRERGAAAGALEAVLGARIGAVLGQRERK